jgi:hypothetical protein
MLCSRFTRYLTARRMDGAGRGLYNSSPSNNGHYVCEHCHFFTSRYPMDTLLSHRPNYGGIGQLDTSGMGFFYNSNSSSIPFHYLLNIKVLSSSVPYPKCSVPSSRRCCYPSRLMQSCASVSISVTQCPVLAFRCPAAHHQALAALAIHDFQGGDVKKQFGISGIKASPYRMYRINDETRTQMIKHL